MAKIYLKKVKDTENGCEDCFCYLKNTPQKTKLCESDGIGCINGGYIFVRVYPEVK